LLFYATTANYNTVHYQVKKTKQHRFTVEGWSDFKLHS